MSSRLICFSELSLKGPHTIVCNTGLIILRRKQLIHLVSLANLDDLCEEKISYLNPRVSTHKEMILEEDQHVLQFLFIKQFQDLCAQFKMLRIYCQIAINIISVKYDSN